jgi:alginate O-acetyltransferase complex protein AlgI
MVLTMVFSSSLFLFYFLPIFLIIYYLLPFQWKGLYLKNTFITFGSYVFYGWLVPWFVLLMLASTTWDYICGKIITKPGQLQWKRKAALLTAIIGDLSLLGFFKYYMFASGGINRAVELLGGGPGFIHIWNILLPSGISFYTFVALSYTIDLYRGHAKPARNFATFSCFIGLFPHLIAGPIIRYSTIAEQLAFRTHTLSKFASGAAIFCLGLGKKIILANSMAPIADAAFGADNPGMLNAWFGVIAYAFQIYFDFCGYSDMAVGLARMLGIEFIKNFDGPYLSRDITVFWRKWHISLSSFIRDYLYIPLGGNRYGQGRTYFNLALTFFLCGLWHGAKMTFVMWGIYQGVFLILERLAGKKSLYHRLPVWGQIGVTFIIVLFGWVLFRAPDLGQAMHYWAVMVGCAPGSVSSTLLSAQIINARSIIEMLLCAAFVWQPIQAHHWIEKLSPIKYLICFGIFIYAISLMVTQSYNPFLYFQF